ncbi:DMT family transporter [Iodobacter fluviatilis]|jgi:small multidrug resistance pump|uniref:QacE family quaternary ammonium compound efflux SMR transporter n=1 Tax=Iodobacter fluviatilis TaxID=537 RepID=A0A7G3GFI8_9NEIS|nr:SMR family transporter [Iodobacter fluviatilis]QBC45545.1 QacE family quaternary ammonium compound efflux SMR transporter [Iodobacter fluviatilis]
MNAYLLLALAIVAEVVATSALKATEGFSRLMPSMVVVIGYGMAFWLLSMVLKSVPVGMAYAIWSGMGIVLVTVGAMLLYGQKPDWPAIIGLSLIVSGVVVLQLFSKMSTH